MHNFRRAFLKWVCLGLGLWIVGSASQLASAADADGRLAAGDKLDILIAGKTTYRNVEIRSISTRTAIITHSAGMASLLLRDLPLELQQRFGYDEALAASTEAQLAAAHAEAERKRLEESRARNNIPSPPARSESKFETLLQQFGRAAELKEQVDLRPEFMRLELAVKSQGRRPSCAVFAVVSALEFQNAELSGKAEKLSEEYLIWATRKTIARTAKTDGDSPGQENEKREDEDAGFALSEVVTALRTYGIPLQESMPNTFGVKMEDIEEPSPLIVSEAQNRRRVFIHSVPGRDQVTRVANIAHALNAGVPVVIGIRWPHYRTVRSGFLSEQKPILDYTHAVTLVGYKCPSGQLADAVFSFKNSYGIDWGIGGYGQASYDYLSSYLTSAVVLEVQPGTPN